jgi:diaminopimelate epimerase
MRIFNSDGSEAEMCGNGARCVAYYISRSQIKIETKAGILEASVDEDNIKIKMTNPTDIRLNSSIKLNKKSLRFNFINTGVPHAVFLCEGIEKIDVHSLGRLVRYHKEFKPRGTNVNFIEPIGLNFIKIRTYERGVEDETLACGTGSVAAAIIYFLKLKKSRLSKLNFAEINVKTVSGEELKVFFDLFRNKIKNVWLEGKAKMVFTGDCYV